MGLILASGGLFAAVGANLLVIQATLRIAEAAPPGSQIRPLGLGLFSLLLTLGGLLIGLPLSVTGTVICHRTRQGWGCLVGGIGTCLSLLPHFLSQYLL